MGKVEYNTDKFYYGFPVYLLGYKDSKHNYNFSTMSSSYTLGNMLTMGLSKHGNAFKQIKKHQCFTVNIPSNELLSEINIGAKNSGKDKFSLAQKLRYSISKKVDAPIIENCILSIECKVLSIIETENVDDFANIISEIQGRIVDDVAIQSDKFDIDLLNPVIFIADSYQRHFYSLDKRRSD